MSEEHIEVGGAPTSVVGKKKPRSWSSIERQAPRVLESKNAHRIRRFLARVKDKGCENALHYEDLAYAVISFYQEDDPRRFAKGRIVARAILSSTFKQTQRAMVREILHKPVGTYYINLLVDMKLLGFKIQERDLELARSQALHAGRISAFRETPGGYLESRENGWDFGLGIIRRFKLGDDEGKRAWLKSLRSPNQP